MVILLTMTFKIEDDLVYRDIITKMIFLFVEKIKVVGLISV